MQHQKKIGFNIQKSKILAAADYGPLTRCHVLFVALPVKRNRIIQKKQMLFTLGEKIKKKNIWGDWSALNQPQQDARGRFQAFRNDVLNNIRLIRNEECEDS